MSDDSKKENPAIATVKETRPRSWDFGPEFEALVPTPFQLWKPVRNWFWVAYITVALAAIPDYFVQYWFNISLGYYTIFFTNLKMQIYLFLIYGALMYLAI